jgi:hypothetical protein
MEFSSHDHIVVTDGVHQREVGDQVFLLLSDSRLFVMENETAVHLWQAICEAGPDGRSLEDLIHGLCDRFETDSETSLKDVRQFVSDLLTDGAVSVRAG